MEALHAAVGGCRAGLSTTPGPRRQHAAARAADRRAPAVPIGMMHSLHLPAVAASTSGRQSAPPHTLALAHSPASLALGRARQQRPQHRARALSASTSGGGSIRPLPGGTEYQLLETKKELKLLLDRLGFPAAILPGSEQVGGENAGGGGGAGAGRRGCLGAAHMVSSENQCIDQPGSHSRWSSVQPSMAWHGSTPSLCCVRHHIRASYAVPCRELGVSNAWARMLCSVAFHAGKPFASTMDHSACTSLRCPHAGSPAPSLDPTSHPAAPHHDASV